MASEPLFSSLTAASVDWQAFPARLDAFLARFFREQAERYDYGAFFEPLYDDLSRYVLRRGKRLRPLLLAASYRHFRHFGHPGGAAPLSFESGIDEETALLRAAAAMELFHAFTLIHDDVIDRSDLRRGLPSFHRAVEARLGLGKGREKEAEGIALVAGNLLHALALDTLLASGFPVARREAALRRFLQAAADTGAGEIGDIVLGTRDIASVSLAEIEQVSHLKTTRYTFEAPLALGAILAGADEASLLDLARVAEPLGLAFQIANDLKDYNDLRPETGGADLLLGKRTLLLRLAYERLPEAERPLLRLALALPAADPSRLPLLRELIGKSDAPAQLRERQAALRLQARRELGPPHASLAGLLGLLDQLDALA
ncbi:geranylgeranyl diphosphate synthase, type I [Verrucomicrobium sp. GAS474]|uniref:polyprenyl synthetase family protein n=1 Tax=Verrucomicrobium sp. GAS474 TaxID=1882831 RepID=UPI00087AB97A|nr:polyprenyl synthetase family protein [Verrucomicrobium sp. GAS474]SDT98187.1 geranylgeranyl diphosphate synthase, type I [Verrucomicrobium sp. GAS474]